MKVTKTITVRTNLDQIQEMIDRLAEILEEANSIKEKLASMDLEVDIDI